MKFVGAFDTVKALSDRNLHDITFNDGIIHMRQALALHEDRQAMEPESITLKSGDATTSLRNRSFVQAWFVGAHMDMGGSAKEDGLSLYPLQWMLEESKQKGLVLEFNKIDGSRIDDPLSIVFPESNKHRQTHSFTAMNGIDFRMHDMRKAHTKGYSVMLNRHASLLWQRSRRRIFEADGSLIGFNSSRK